MNWLETLGAGSVDDAIGRVRTAFLDRGFGLRANGRFVVLDVGAAKSVVRAEVGLSLRIEHYPLPDDPSHAGISGYLAHDLAVAVELSALVSEGNVYLAIA